MTSTSDILASTGTTSVKVFSRHIHGETTAVTLTRGDVSASISTYASRDAYPSAVDVLNDNMENIRRLDRCPEDFPTEADRDHVRAVREDLITLFGQDIFDQLYANGETFFYI